MIKRLSTLLLCYLLCLAPSASAHKYFFSISDLQLNQETNHIEVIHQITLHDLDFLLKDKLAQDDYQNKKRYESALQDYIVSHFQLFADDEQLTARWVGYEISFGQLIIYQEFNAKLNSSAYTIKNSLLVDNFPQQINTVNYVLADREGSLTFNNKKTKITVTLK